jgi:type VI secretion system protein ImpI
MPEKKYVNYGQCTIMNMPNASHSLYLQVMNPELLERGALPTHTFDSHGGTIGCRGANWLLHDYTGGVAAIHAEITTRDNHYCLIDRSGRTRVNSSIDSIGLNRIIQLNEGDTLHIGRYQVKVRVQDLSTQYIGQQKRLSDINMVELVEQKKEAYKKGQLLANTQGNEVSLIDVDVQTSYLDSNAILINEVPPQILDPLAAFSDHAMDENVKTAHKGEHDHVFTNIKQTLFNSKISLEPLQGGQNLSGDTPSMTNPSNMPDDNIWDEFSHGEKRELDYLVLAPLLKGMGISLENMDSDKAHDFLVETGQAVQATISGIQALYQQDNNATLNLALLSRNLQPIEDNPLRLKQPYDKTMNALFSPSRSRVHLSPPAAIDESLTQIGLHQDSVLIAIQESLNSLLQAFSPDVLNTRFQRYAKSGEQKELDDAWSWQMYNEYYSELMSSRQTGFEKLFWEIFEQSYDRAMRQSTNRDLCTKGCTDKKG